MGLCVLIHAVVTVADSKHEQSYLVIVAAAEVGNIPAEHVIANLVILRVVCDLSPSSGVQRANGGSRKFILSANASASTIILLISERFILLSPYISGVIKNIPICIY